MAAVGVEAVGAEGGDLRHFIPRFRFCRTAGGGDKNDAEVSADGKGAGKEIKDDLRRGRSCDVVVVRLAAKQQIAHAAAGEIGLVAGLTQRCDDPEGGVELGVGGRHRCFLLSRLLAASGRVSGKGSKPLLIRREYSDILSHPFPQKTRKWMGHPHY